jgi:hypothetical protein
MPHVPRSKFMPLVTALLLCCGAPPKPVELAKGLRWPMQVAADGSFVYVLEVDGSVLRVAKAGGPLETVAPARAVVANNEIPFLDGFSLAVDAEAVWFTAYTVQSGVRTGEVWKVPLGGAPTLLASWPGEPAYLAVDADGVYVAHAPYLPVPGVLVKLPRAGGSPTTLAVGMIWPSAVASDAQNIYWLARGPTPGEYATGEVGFVPKAGGDAKQLATQLHLPVALQTGPDAVYWLDDASHESFGTMDLTNHDAAITKYDFKLGGGNHVVTGLSSGLNGFAVDGSEVFFIDWTAKQAHLNGIGWDVVELSDALGAGQSNVVADAKALYWAGWVSGGPTSSVFKLPIGR